MRTAFAFAIAAGLLLSAVGVIFSPQLLWMTDVNAEIYAEALLYLRICMIGTMFTVIYNIGAGVLHSFARVAMWGFYLPGQILILLSNWKAGGTKQ